MKTNIIIKRTSSFTAALLLSLSTLLAIQVPSAFAATVTWDGGGADNNFSTAANWTGDTVPSNGDDLVFDNSSLASYEDGQLTNDLTSASFASITFSGNGSTSYGIDGSAFTLTGAITINVTGTYNSPSISTPLTLTGDKTISVPTGVYFRLDGNLSGSGNIAKSGTGSLYLGGDNSSYTGIVSVSAGVFGIGSKGLAGASSGATVGDGASFYIDTCDSNLLEINTLTLTGASADTTSAYPDAKMTVQACTGGGGGADEMYGYPVAGENIEITGNITLGSDITALSYSPVVTVKGTLNGQNNKINLFAGSAAKLVIQADTNNSGMPNGEYASPTLVKELTDDLPSSSVSATGNTVLVITGKRGEINLQSGATLKGTGTVGAVFVSVNSKVAPGLSPGTLNTGAISWTEGGIYEFEIGKDAADQIKVTGTVDLGKGTLTPILYNGYKPAAGKQYIIIENDGTDAVMGTFKDLAEGATFKKDGYVYRVSYVGGTGNDVVLTVVSVPSIPDTGLALIKSNPLATLIGATFAAGSIVYMSRRMKPATKRSRR